MPKRKHFETRRQRSASLQSKSGLTQLNNREASSVTRTINLVHAHASRHRASTLPTSIATHQFYASPHSSLTEFIATAENVPGTTRPSGSRIFCSLNYKMALTFLSMIACQLIERLRPFHIQLVQTALCSVFHAKSGMRYTHFSFSQQSSSLSNAVNFPLCRFCKRPERSRRRSCRCRMP